MAKVIHPNVGGKMILGANWAGWPEMPLPSRPQPISGAKPRSASHEPAPCGEMIRVGTLVLHLNHCEKCRTLGEQATP